jgi:hypothetical protein
VMSVSERVSSPSIPAHVLERIQAIPSSIRTKLDVVPKRTIWLVAASIAALIAVNIYVSSTTNSANTSATSFNETYFSHLNQL